MSEEILIPLVISLCENQDFEFQRDNNGELTEKSVQEFASLVVSKIKN